MRLLACSAAVAALAMLSGCSGENDELTEWMQQQHNEVKPDVPPVYPPKKFDPQAYEGAAAVDPFSTAKLGTASAAPQHDLPAAFVKDKNHTPEHLESYPLDSIVMVGSLMRSGQPHGLVKVDNLLYDVTIGMYMGQNSGKITGISDNEITLREWTQDASGEWVERTTSLQLQEKAR
jgi:type IV pilus assembly protein PilP